MDYSKRLILYLLLVSLILVIMVFCIIITAKDVYTSSQSLSECFYTAPKTPYYPEIYTLGTISIDVNQVDLLECMVRLESSGNPEAYNPMDTDGLPAIGLLQYKKGTFKMYCVEKYNYPNDIWNESIQYMCADDMMRDGYGYLWGTYNRCIEQKNGH